MWREAVLWQSPCGGNSSCPVAEVLSDPAGRGTEGWLTYSHSSIYAVATDSRRLD